MPKPHIAHTGGLQAKHLLAWSLVSIISSMMMIPLNALIPAFYAKNTAIDLATIGIILMAARLYDAVADPAVGYLSDRTRGPLGRRKPWIIGGGVLATGAVYLLFNPPAAASGSYLLPVLLIFYTAYSMLAVPHSAWGSELSRAYRERSMISGVLTFASVVGLLLFMGLPLLLSSPLLPLFATAEITPPMLKLLGWLILALIPLCIGAAVIFAPIGTNADESGAVTLRGVARSLRINRPFWTFAGAYALTGLAYGVYYGTSYIFIDAYLGMADKFPVIYATAAIAQMVSIPLWTRLSQTYERKHIWALGIASFGLLLTLRVFVPPGQAGFPWLLALATIASFANAASQVPQMAVLADCIDYDTLRTRANRAGSYYAIQQFVLKATLAAGGGAAFLALSLMEFDARAAIHSRASLNGLALVHTGAPLILFTAAGVILWLFPLDRDRQRVIRRRLERRAASEMSLVSGASPHGS
ncbi:MAG: MFS transporter [Phenylobacterium sp.]|uniref:MFS transporter n=1 Tax=Phenylobacterium sp. TaxID=1871053 RepID=UPI001A5B4AF7|nr:MFS transporter [Phenylobacterium sp.]MBL8553995.1 MFS transporter [Phenylobacterium sp.]